MSKKTSTLTQTRDRVLTETEEKVVRMRHGLKAPEDLELEFLDQAHPEAAAQIRAIEERALAAVGPRRNSTKLAIVKSLRKRR